MKKEAVLLLILTSLCLLISPFVFAIQPVTMVGPVPAIGGIFPAGSSHSFVYTITNRVPKSLPLSIEGISGPINRTTVSNDCGQSLPPADGDTPSTCNIGISIAPTQSNVGTRINQTLEVNYQGRRPLTSNISFFSRQAMLYVSNFSGNSISQCVVNLDTGVISNCFNFVDPTFSALADITINPARTYAYISNNGSNSISICAIGTNGFLRSPCRLFASPILAGVAGTAINATGTVLYTANFGNSTLGTCRIDHAGMITQCAQSAPFANQPADIALDPANQFAYVTAGTVYRCPIAANGNLDACVPSPAMFFNNPTGISVNAAGTIMYVNNAMGNTVSVCQITPFTSCTSSDPDGTFAIGFGKNTTFQNSFLFVANQDSNTVSVCSLNASGQLVSCPASNPSGTFSGPEGVALN